MASVMALSVLLHIPGTIVSGPIVVTSKNLFENLPCFTVLVFTWFYLLHRMDYEAGGLQRERI